MSTKTMITSIIVGVVLVVVVLGIKMLRSNVTDRFGNSSSEEIKTAEVTVGSISTTVIETMSDVQSQIDQLDSELSRLESAEVSDTISSNVKGRVKKIYAEAGTTSSVNVSENDGIEMQQSLITLTNTDNIVNYQTILKKRNTLEDELQNLIVIYKEGAVYAKADGLITSLTIPEDGTTTTTTLSNTSSPSGLGDMSGNSGSGAVVSTTSSDDASDTIISISPTDKMTMVVSVDESEILSLSVGQEAQVSVDSVSDETFSGTITKIDKTGTSSSGVTTYSATVEIDRTENMLEGMSASAIITIEGKENALLVPTDAVKKTSSTAYVYTSYDEKTKELKDMVEVTIGLSNGSYTEITDGLSEGDTVYYSVSQKENTFTFGGQSGFGNMPGGFDVGNMPSGGMPGNMGGSRGGKN